MLSLLPASVPNSLTDIPEDTAGATRATLNAMVSFARSAKKDVGINTLAKQIIASAPGRANQKNYYDFIRVLQHFVRDCIRYVPDPQGLEWVQSPQRTLEIRSGDCDDKATLLGALLATVNIPAQFMAVGYGGQDAPYSHVFVQAKYNRNWIPLETIMDGWEPGRVPESSSKRISRWMTANI